MLCFYGVMRLGAGAGHINTNIIIPIYSQGCAFRKKKILLLKIQRPTKI